MDLADAAANKYAECTSSPDGSSLALDMLALLHPVLVAAMSSPLKRMQQMNEISATACTASLDASHLASLQTRGQRICVARKDSTSALETGHHAVIGTNEIGGCHACVGTGSATISTIPLPTTARVETEAPRNGSPPPQALHVRQVHQEVNSLTRHARLRRRMTNASSLRVVYITKAMAERLLADVGAGGEEHGFGLSADDHAVNSGWLLSQACLPLQTTIMLEDCSGVHWPVKLVGSMAARQVHRRMTAGWHEFCVAHDVRLGDAVEFRRVKGRFICLHARVMRRRA